MKTISLLLILFTLGCVAHDPEDVYVSCEKIVSYHPYWDRPHIRYKCQHNGRVMYMLSLKHRRRLR